MRYPPAMAYCEQLDLLIDHNMYADPTEKDRYIKFAAESMDAKLGYVYVTPINTSGLPSNQMSLLRTINAQLATGRLIMSRSSAAQDSQVNAYALYLIRQAESDLMAVANGTVDLLAPRVDSSGVTVGALEDPTVDDAYARVPGGWNPDRVSPVTAFEKNIMIGSTESLPWAPGENIAGDGGESNIR